MSMMLTLHYHVCNKHDNVESENVWSEYVEIGIRVNLRLSLFKSSSLFTRIPSWAFSLMLHECGYIHVTALMVMEMDMPIIWVMHAHVCALIHERETKIILKHL